MLTASISKMMLDRRFMGVRLCFVASVVNRIIMAVENLSAFPEGDSEIGEWEEWRGVELKWYFTVYQVHTGKKA